MTLLMLLQRVLPRLFAGLEVTVALATLSLLFGLLLGSLLGIVRATQVRYVAYGIGTYVHLVRGTPFIVQLYIVYFVLPRLGWHWLELNAWTAAVLALSLYAGAYVTEIVRGAIEGVPAGQAEAAAALGLPKWQGMVLIVLPQALRAAVPPLAGLSAVVIKSTSIASVVGISELLRAGQNLALSQPASLLPIQGLVALIYLVTCWPLLRLAAFLEKRH